ncbi:protocatechuate 4,5-dioxygenase subunit alpha [Sphingobium sp. SCG-1]|uniref:protocatechuate 4,5-dioxygenase subunit alpha n=1 Tax=Sphingobium sp. SCG-1 TaxID=2072936 RepID=UPI000CD6A6C7|nr:protocatechuate 4,5-dioxygenase subunit alpha [Sphingobium sp. SCG-1]AUW57182.1 protocatechuate 4,5-dioxygenase subunit alpha [Sphingobium sp. SCG-1]
MQVLERPPIDVEAYLADLDDIPGTYIFDAKRARAGFHMNQFAMSLMKEENRTRWKADERSYLAEWTLSDEQRDAILARDYNRCLELGGNIYFLVKIASTDGLSTLQCVSTMSGLDIESYRAMMIAGGRSPDGNRSIKEKR